MTIPDVTTLIAYEDGELDEDQTIEFFAGMIKSGVVWSLQGSYGRMAAALIESGVVTRNGEVL